MKLSDVAIPGRPDKPINLVRPHAEPVRWRGVQQQRARGCADATFILLHDKDADLTDEERAALRLTLGVWRRLS